MTHAELVTRAARWLKNSKRCGIVLTEFRSSSCEEPDAIGWQYGGKWSILIECKTSVADFCADQRKPFRRRAIAGIGRERYYMTAKGLLGVDRVKRSAPGWGLIEVCGRVCRVRLKPIPFGHEVTWRELPLLYSYAQRIQEGWVKS